MATDPREKNQDDIQAPEPDVESDGEEITKPPPEPERWGLFKKRMSSDWIAFGDCKFHYNALPATVYSALVDKALNRHGIVQNAMLTVNLFRYGVTAIDNLTTEDNEIIEAKFVTDMIGGKSRNVLSIETTNGLPLEVINIVSAKVLMMSRWSEKDAERLGFIKESTDGKSSASGNSADTQTESTN